MQLADGSACPRLPRAGSRQPRIRVGTQCLAGSKGRRGREKGEAPTLLTEPSVRGSRLHPGLGRPCGVAPELKDRAQRASRPSTCCPEPLGPRSYLPTCVPRPFTHPREQPQPRQPCPSVLGGHKVYVIWGQHPCGSTPGRLQAPTCTGARQAYGWRWGPALDLQTTVPSVPGRGAQARTSHRPSHIRSQTTAPPTPPPRWRVRRRGRAEQRRRACRAAAALTVQCLAGPCCREHALFHS